MAHTPDQPSAPSGRLWDEKKAQALLKRTMLIGITHPETATSPVRREQVYGVVSTVDQTRGICVELKGARAGEVLWLPPQTGNIARANPGVYRLKGTGEEVKNPDYLCTWMIHPPKSCTPRHA